MSSPVNEVLAAIHARLGADPALATLLAPTDPQGGPGGDPAGTAIRDRRLDHQVLPCLLLSTVETRDRSTGEAGGLELLLSFEAWSETGRQQAEEIAARVRDLLHDANLALPTATLVSLFHRGTTSRRLAKTSLFVAVVRMRAVVE